MKYLLDTCVISELIKPKPNKNVIRWIKKNNEHDLKERFKNRILPIDINVAKIWGQIQGISELKGKPMPAIDSLIAATGLLYDLIVVTQNISDMQQSQVVLLNPWVLEEPIEP